MQQICRIHSLAVVMYAELDALHPAHLAAVCRHLHVSCCCVDGGAVEVSAPHVVRQDGARRTFSKPNLEPAGINDRVKQATVAKACEICPGQAGGNIAVAVNTCLNTPISQLGKNCQTICRSTYKPTDPEVTKLLVTSAMAQ
jgi:hypothetical protein